jgi:hypothetical protein
LRGLLVSGQSLENFSVSNNKINILGSKINGLVIGRLSAGGSIDNNTINISNATLEGGVVLGSSLDVACNIKNNKLNFLIQ